MNNEGKIENSGIKFSVQVIVFLAFIFCIFYGLVLRPVVFGQIGLEIESVMILAAMLTGGIILLFTKVTIEKILESAFKQVSNALPGIILLLFIGIAVGGLVFAGTMPMLIYYGIKIIDVRFIFLFGFILSLIFSIFTGSSWGSAATMGVVMMGIGSAVNTNLAILAGAIIGGAYFGDKMSPLSDTTNLAAIAGNVNLYDHIGSMFWTTIPSAIIACIAYLALGFIYAPDAAGAVVNPDQAALLADLSNLFNFNILLIIPLLIILYGSFKKYNGYIVMSVGGLSALLIGIIFQSYNFNDAMLAIGNGYTTDMASWYQPTTELTASILNKGGFWYLANLLPISITILSVVGVMNSIQTIPTVVGRIMGWAKTTTSLIFATILTGIIMIASTANGIACSFVTCSIFSEKYDNMGIDRRVLTRCCEDTGTLLEVLFPWTPAAIFFTATLGVATIDYAPWAIMNYTAPIIDILLAQLGLGLYRVVKAKGKENYAENK